MFGLCITPLLCLFLMQSGLPISVGIPFFVARTSRRYPIIAVTALTALQVGVAALFPLHSVLSISILVRFCYRLPAPSLRLFS